MLLDCFPKNSWFQEKQSFLFDLDGTLIDSVPAHNRAFLEALQLYQQDLIEKFDYSKLKGKSTLDAFLELGVMDRGQAELLTRAKQESYRAQLKRGEVYLFPYSFELLKKLYKLKKRMFLITSSSKHSVETVLQKTEIGPFFEGIITSEEVTQNKPSPEIFLLALKRFFIFPETAVTVEDSQSGVRSSVLAGVPVVLVNQPDSYPSCGETFRYSSIESLFNAL